MNFYNFTGGMVNRKSPYLMKTDELIQLRNFDIEGGGLTIRKGTKKLYGPYDKPVDSIHKALSAKGHEILFIKTGETAQMVVGGVACNGSLLCTTFQVLPVTNGFAYLVGGIGRQMIPVYRRCDEYVKMTYQWEGALVIEKLPDDYTTDGEFPADLYEKNIWDTQTDSLYYAVAHTTATKENIQNLLQTNAFVRIGGRGDVLHMQFGEQNEYVLNLKTGYCGSSFFTVWVENNFLNLFPDVPTMSDTAKWACACPYFVWHPASMRYFAAGHPDNPTALYVSEPNEWYNFSSYNVLYPHLHLGGITGLLVVEKSVVVCYEHGWSHYVGADPMVDGQWSLLSAPDGTNYGKTICLTPGSVSFFTRGELLSFSSSMLTVQMLYSPSSSLYKFLSKEKLSLPTSPEKAFAYYKDGNYYLALDNVLYVYHVSLGAFTCYDGFSCSCITEDYQGRILMGNKNCVVCFDSSLSTDYNPVTEENEPISYEAKFPVLGAVSENELARCSEVVVKHCGGGEGLRCTVKLTSERGHCEGSLIPSNHLQYGISPWNRRYYSSHFSETVFPWRVSGNMFCLEISGGTAPGDTVPFSVLNIYLELKKERNKL
ncbi:MAG: hypothetical protein J6K51_02855 [Clostridia bacterium]|nr:hypothetical protein [Clostridia bacterium]